METDTCLAQPQLSDKRTSEQTCTRDKFEWNPTYIKRGPKNASDRNIKPLVKSPVRIPLAFHLLQPL